MPATLGLTAAGVDLVDDYVAALRQAGLRSGRSTVQAARTFRVKLERAQGWGQLSRARQIDAIRKAPAFASWLMVTGQLSVNAEILGRVDLRLGNAARTYCPDAHRWFVDAAALIGISPADISLQWNALAKVTATTATPPDRVGAAEFERARTAIINAYVERGLPQSGRNMASIFHRLQLTLFHAGRLDNHRRPIEIAFGVEPTRSVTTPSLPATNLGPAACGAKSSRCEILGDLANLLVIAGRRPTDESPEVFGVEAAQ